MTQNIPRRGGWSIKLCSDDSPQVSDRNLHRVGRSTLGLTGNIDSGPREYERDGRIDSHGGEERAHIRDARLVCGVLVREEDDVADDRQ